MAYSSLISKEVRADSSNYTHYRNGKICKITPHHMAGIMTGEACAKLFQNPSRNCSATYCIGYNGEIVGNVPEEYRPWTSSSGNNDHQAITIEISNDVYDGDWHISDASWNSLVNLCVDICKRYNFRLNYTGDASGSLTRHNMFAATACPGPYLQSRFQELADTVNAKLNGSQPTPAPQPKQTSSNGFLGSKGYFKYGDTHANIGKIAKFMRNTFPAYTNAKALGNTLGPNLTSSIKEFQRRCKQSGLYNDKIDGMIGEKTLACLKHYGFKEN